MITKPMSATAPTPPAELVRCPGSRSTTRLHWPGCRCQLDAASTRGYLQSLAAIGWSIDTQGHHIGMSGHHAHRILTQPTVTLTTALRVARMWEQWWDIPGPSDRAIAHATRRGWDAPDPEVVRRLLRRMPTPYTHHDRDQAIRVLLGRGLTTEAVLGRLSVGRSTVHRVAAGTAAHLAARTDPGPIRPSGVTPFPLARSAA